MERRSFILGMMTAFAECLAAECKKTAFSPPFAPEDYEEIREEAERIAEEQGIYLWYEHNPDLPAEERVHWFVMYKFPEVLEEYRRLRANGYNPIRNIQPFFELLSYGTAWAENAGTLVPRFREKRPTQDTLARILFGGAKSP